MDGWATRIVIKRYIPAVLSRAAVESDAGIADFTVYHVPCSNFPRLPELPTDHTDEHRSVCPEKPQITQMSADPSTHPITQRREDAKERWLSG